VLSSSRVKTSGAVQIANLKLPQPQRLTSFQRREGSGQKKTVRSTQYRVSPCTMLMKLGPVQARSFVALFVLTTMSLFTYPREPHMALFVLTIMYFFTVPREPHIQLGQSAR
jgi:hypothetical protein